MMRLGVDTPVERGKLTVIALVAERRESAVSGGRLWFRGERLPVAVVIKRAGTLRAFLIDGREEDPRRLAAAVPELGPLLG